MTERSGILQILEQARADLLDLSARNRLLDTPRRRSRTRTLEIVDELSGEIFRILVAEKRTMTFLAGRTQDEADEEEAEDTLFSDLGLPEDEEPDERGIAKRHRDTKLLTTLDPDRLQKRLLGLYYDARTYEEEQGVNILYLALGFLKWIEAESSDRARHAPLILVPVILERESALDRFKLSYRDDEFSTNLSLHARLRADFGIELPELPDVDEIGPADYFERVRKAISARNRWEVLDDDIVLGFFSFSKFLMYRDLDPGNWPADRNLAAHPIIEPLLTDGFEARDPLFDEEKRIDDLVAPIDMVHVLDADSSQTIAIEEVKRGRNLVIQGPPGTGKSQTITNMIATAVKAGKKVLFMAEKMAALDVVMRRLEDIGLGETCLELHSHKANKRRVLEALDQTLALGRPLVDDLDVTARKLESARDRLNGHAALMHRRVGPSGLTPYRIIGELARFTGESIPLPAFQLAAAPAWARPEAEERTGLVRDIAERIAELGTPAAHPWRGVGAEPMLPSDTARLRDRIAAIVDEAKLLLGLATSLSTKLSYGTDLQVGDVARLVWLGSLIAEFPKGDPRGFADPSWATRDTEIAELVQTGAKLTLIERSLRDKVVDAAWSIDLSPMRRDLAAYGGSMFRMLNGRYRTAQAELRGLMTFRPPKALEDRLTIVDGLIAGQNARRTLKSLDSLGKGAFGDLWRGARSDWTSLQEIVDWERKSRTRNRPENFLHVVARLGNLDSVSGLAKEIEERSRAFSPEVRDIVATLRLDLPTAFEATDMDAVGFEALSTRLQDWLSDMEGLSKWIVLRTRLEAAREAGLDTLVDRLVDGRIGPELAVDQYRYAYLETLMREIVRAYPDLAAFDGGSHGKIVERFKALDRERIGLAREEVAQAHHAGIPRGGMGGAGEIGVIRHEINKKRRHMPLRRLMDRAGNAVQAVKPVFMMSPMSVAQFLPPGNITFDLLLIDEASQVLPIDALGAIARAHQIVVVGDERQLPPTRFFARGVDTIDDFDNETQTVGDLESILGLCSSRGLPECQLRWHYRSRHHSLIAVSNHEFYDDRLFIVPSPYRSESDLGVSFQHVRDGVFDRGRSGTNRPEARVVARAVVEHARRFPDMSLGVGAFSIRQRQAILDELEHLWRQATDVKDYFARGGAEPFFVKNLENIQGDERDVIFISVGYGRDSDGFFSMNFGPLSAEGGERRLNVLISRARKRCRVFSSITADDIDLARARGRGPAAFKTFLRFAETGSLWVGRPTGRDFESPFEEAVGSAVRRQGFEIEPQIGIAGFFIDIGVVDPDNPGCYVLGIECDGAAYHSARSARDRDRLRQEVLEGQGWTIHRIWGPDWFQRPEEETRKILAAIEDARNKTLPWEEGSSSDLDDPDGDGSSAPKIRRLDRDDDANHPPAVATIPYAEATFAVPRRVPLHEVQPAHMAGIVRQVVEVEGPIHVDGLAQRITSLWGLRRTGSRIAAAVVAGVRYAVRDRAVVQRGRFVDMPDRPEIPVRDRSQVTLQVLRQPDILPPAEIGAAIEAVVAAHVAISLADAVVEVARLLGFRATSAQLRRVIERVARQWMQEARLVERKGKLYGVGDAGG